MMGQLLGLGMVTWLITRVVALSQSLREVLPLMRLVQELADTGFQLSTDTPMIHCKIFKDNTGALEIARTPKIRPRTKHMNLK
jgi:hypothetical protein